jgi:hypothetical protein
MSDVNEQLEFVKHADEATHHNRDIALLIAILALCLALSEMLGKGANTEALTLTVKAADTWNFYQAKTIRRTVLTTAAEELRLSAQTATEVERPGIDKQIADWTATAARYQSEPDGKGGGEGTRELMQRAKNDEAERDTALARFHNFEIASAAFQVGIVLCSAAVITGVVVLAWVAGGLAVFGLAFVAFGLLAPHFL